MKSLDQFGDVSNKNESSGNYFKGDILEGCSESFGRGYNLHLCKSDKNGIVRGRLIGSVGYGDKSRFDEIYTIFDGSKNHSMDCPTGA